jgi:7-cyano-7-deazaguanine synthase in queuosine biosynthesis
MKTITIAGVDIDIHDENVGIYMSGGADSSLLLYILMKHCTKKIHIFTCASQAKQFSSATSSRNIIKKCVELTGNFNVMHHMTFVNIQDDHLLFSPYREFIDKGIVNLVYHGVTANPPKEVSDTFSNPADTPNLRNPSQTRVYYKQGSNLYTPFTNSNKQKVKEMYKELDIEDTLFPLTRSCEDPSLAEGHCGTCWWCEERQWGFGRLE